MLSKTYLIGEVAAEYKEAGREQPKPQPLEESTSMHRYASLEKS